MEQNFLFGTATAAYQIEGAIHEDGRTDSIWDTYASIPGNTHNGESGQYADDSYHRLDQDIALLKKLGINAYRFSIGVPRIIPNKSETINEVGLDHYDHFVDLLLEAGIKPYLTLFHWDLPQWLEDNGGWMNRDTPYRLADYAKSVADRLGDRIYCYTTLNEPECSAYGGYVTGNMAPGRKLGAAGLKAVHHHNLAHGLMTEAVRSVVGHKTHYSVSLNLQQYYGDPEACRRMDAMANKIWTEPMLRGRYAEETLTISQSVSDWSFVKNGDEQLIHQPIDILGLNYYTPWTIRLDSDVVTLDPSQSRIYPGCDAVQFVEVAGEKTDMGWTVDPQSLTDILVRITKEYPEIPIIITENGRASSEGPQTDPDGAVRVHDISRINYLKQHFKAAQNAMQQGVDLRGYFVWSLMDNYEWTSGYSKRFGLTWVNYDTFERIPKDSFYWYKDHIAKRSLVD